MKTSKFMNVLEKDGIYIIHNSLHNTALKVYDDELKKIVDNIKENKGMFNMTFSNERQAAFYNDLIESKFVLDNKYNEDNVLNFKQREYYSNITNKTLFLLIIPTRACNFRCPYCYEEHTNDFMSDSLYNSIKKLVVNLVNEKKYSRVLISWFGGEPMLCYDNISTFMSELREMLPQEIILSGQMTTNGYLLTYEKFVKLVDLGVDNYQITVDGLSEIHNKTRFLAGGAGTWDVIIKNLKSFKSIKNDYMINIRTNISKELTKDAEPWFAFLSENFGEDERFRFHFESIKDLGGEDKSLQLEGCEDYTDPFSEFSEIAIKNGISKKNIGLVEYYMPFSKTCYAANPDSLLIDFDGKIKKCTVSLEEDYNVVGNIDDSGAATLFENQFSWWTDYNLKEECKHCSVLPICMGKKCPNAYYNEESCKNVRTIYNVAISHL